MFDHCWSFEKASLSVRILKRAVVSNIRCKICWKAWVRERFYSNFEKRGVRNWWPVTSFLTIFFREILWPLGCFQRLRVLKQILVSRKLKISRFRYHEIFVFLKFVFHKRRFIAENWLCFRACNSRIVTYDQEFCHCGVIFVL